MNPDVQPDQPITPAPQPIEKTPSGLQLKKGSKRKKIFLFSGLGLLVVILAIATVGFFWYQSQLSAVGTNKDEFIKVTIEPDSTPSMIGKFLASMPGSAERKITYRQVPTDYLHPKQPPRLSNI